MYGGVQVATITISLLVHALISSLISSSILLGKRFVSAGASQRQGGFISFRIYARAWCKFATHWATEDVIFRGSYQK